MSRTDVIYLLMLMLSMPYGYLVKRCGSNTLRKKILCLSGGLLIAFTLVGIGGLIHSFIVILFTYGLISFKPRNYQWIGYICTFGYLLFFRTCKYFGLPEPPKHCNAIQLLVTLKMISLCFEVKEQTDRLKNKDLCQKRNELPESFLDLCAYGYSYIGLMTGPFYKYETFIDMLYTDTTYIPTVSAAMKNLKLILFIGIPYLYVKELYPMEYFLSKTFLEHQYGFIYRLFEVAILAAWFRSRFYIGWTMAESACMFAGLGMYPVDYKSKPGQGPTVYKLETHLVTDKNNTKSKCKDNTADKKMQRVTEYDFESIHNINIEIERLPRMKDMNRYWNSTVQWWLLHYVYKHIPVKSRQLRLLLLVLISAYWHGIHPGYYIAFVTFAMYIIAENSITAALKPYLNIQRQQYFDWISWFCAMRYLEYMALPFHYLDIDKTFVIYKSIYFYGHIFVLVITILSMIIAKANK